MLGNKNEKLKQDFCFLHFPHKYIPKRLFFPISLPSLAGAGYELADFPERDLLFCLTSTESYLDLSAQDLEFGFNESRRDRILRTFVRNSYYFHLNEIFSTLKNEYTDWERPVLSALNYRDATLEVILCGTSSCQPGTS